MENMVMDKIIYKTKVIEIGSDAQEFASIDMLIFFGQEAPDALRSSCFIINVNEMTSPIETGMILQIGNQKYRITSVGNEVNTNLAQLGHVAVKFDGSTEAELPGSLYVEKKAFPNIEVGTPVSIIA